MGRRRSSGGSAAGSALLLLLGGFIALVTAAYQYVRDNLHLIVALASFAAAIVLLVLLVRLARRKQPQPPASAGLPNGPARVASTKLSPARWITPGEAVNIRGTAIASGLFYLGEAVPLGDGRLITQCAINPALPAASGPGDVAGSSMPYWPSYTDIPPQARRAFIDWMGGGRKNPAIGIGHVFIFFYGLEHRMFIEGGGGASEAIGAEVRRLLTIYGDNNSFRQYASKFLSCASVASEARLAPPQLTPELNGVQEMPLGVRLYLGAKLSKTDQLGADDSLLWLFCLPDFRARTPAVRCFEEFTTLWRYRFAAAFPGGYRISVPSTRLKISYRAASGAFEVDIPGPHSQHPDVAAVRQSFDDLKSLADLCMSDLDPFSRFVGRRPERRATIQAALLLPEPIRRQAGKGAAQGLGVRISALMGGRGTATTQLRDLLAASSFDIPESGQVPQSAADQLGEALDLLDIAIEPDRRYGGGVPHVDDHVVVFTAERGGAIDAAKPSYRAMKVRVEVAALAAAADGVGTSDELQTIIGTIRDGTDLTQIERLRLIGYAVTIFKSPPKRARILDRLADTEESQKRAIAAAAIAVIVKRDQADPKEVQFLEKLHKTLKLPAGQIYGDLHRGLPADEPVPVSLENRVSGIRIPQEPPRIVSPPQSGIRIDQRRLADVKRDTAAVSEILSRIFVDEPQAPEPAYAAAQAGNSAFDGLDSGHAQLVIYLQAAGEVARPEFESRARSLKLLPAGAIERINDWSFDHFDEPLLEEGESIAIIPHLRQRLSELKESVS